MAVVQRGLSFGSLCRALHTPPPLKSSCCIRIPAEIVKDPDPATYDAERLFASGVAPTFNSPDINTVHLWPVKPLDILTTTIRNVSPDAAAQRTRVDLAWSPFGIGLETLPIASTFVDLARAGTPASEQTLSWPTPPALIAAGRYGVFLELHHPFDRDRTNNRGQQTVDGMQTSQGRSRTFIIPVRNPHSDVRTIALSISPSPFAAWATLAPAAFTLAGGAQKDVAVKIDVPVGLPVSPPGTLISATIDVMAQSSGTLIGGVSLIILLDS